MWVLWAACFHFDVGTGTTSRRIVYASVPVTDWDVVEFETELEDEEEVLTEELELEEVLVPMIVAEIELLELELLLELIELELEDELLLELESELEEVDIEEDELETEELEVDIEEDDELDELEVLVEEFGSENESQ